MTVDTTAPVISFNTVAGDDVINRVEHTQAQIISGTATGAVAGDRLVVTIAGQQYVTSTDASGNWSVGVPASVISGLADGTVTISATITDERRQQQHPDAQRTGKHGGSVALGQHHQRR